MLDKMSFTRTITTMERLCLSKNAFLVNKRAFPTTPADHILYPLQLYSNMLSTLSMMLDSQNITYYEIVLGAIYRLYYTSNNRLDILSKLFNAYRNNHYPIEYMYLLITILHETMKLLEKAKEIYTTNNPILDKYNHIYHGLDGLDRQSQIQKAKKLDSQNPKSRDLDMESYILACYRFNIDEYFRRLVNIKVMYLYLKVAEHFVTNSNRINHYVVCYFTRCIEYTVPFKTKNGLGKIGFLS
jgi:hypothetical protein